MLKWKVVILINGYKSINKPKIHIPKRRGNYLKNTGYRGVSVILLYGAGGADPRRRNYGDG